MVHIHPGALHKLSPMSGNYNWMHWATQTQTIVVGITFRLGIFGHYASVELNKEQGGRIGNNGFLDQRLALQWIRDNIGVFGGDPSRVFLFGLSSGALACAWHAASPGSTGLFHGCIAESGPGGENYYQAKADSFRFWGWFTEKFFGCATLECVRSVDAAALNIFVGNETQGWPDWAPATFPAFPYAGMMDGTDIVEYPVTMAREGMCEVLNCSIGRVPVILASTAEECHSFMPRVVQFIPTLTHLKAQKTGLMQAVGKEARAAFADWFAGWQMDEEVMDLACDMYPAWMYESGGSLLSYMYRDQRYTCPQQRLFRAWNSWKSGREKTAPAYFVFNQRGKRSGRMAMHGWLYEGVLELTPRSHEMLCYYAGLIHKGDPNSQPAVPACKAMSPHKSKAHAFQRMPSSLDSAHDQDVSYILVPQHDTTPIQAFKFPVSYRDRTSARDPPSLDTCDAWEAWHGGLKPLFLPHAELHKDARARACNATTDVKPFVKSEL